MLTPLAEMLESLMGGLILSSGNLGQGTQGTCNNYTFVGRHDQRATIFPFPDFVRGRCRICKPHMVVLKWCGLFLSNPSTCKLWSVKSPIHSACWLHLAQWRDCATLGSTSAGEAWNLPTLVNRANFDRKVPGIRNLRLVQGGSNMYCVRRG
ncbi:Uncharacterized protein HZ326_29445 [Fusarium oxysporum f. sp. albedinis]|nr:Uncharacterized protein HZ326_29445 [Fusarium oxysporum f. sp. albedinis]